MLNFWMFDVCSLDVWCSICWVFDGGWMLGVDCLMLDLLSECWLQETAWWVLLWSTVKALFGALIVNLALFIYDRQNIHSYLRLRWIHQPLMVASRPSCFNLLGSILKPVWHHYSRLWCELQAGCGNGFVSETVKKWLCVYVPNCNSCTNLPRQSPPHTHLDTYKTTTQAKRNCHTFCMLATHALISVSLSLALTLSMALFRNVTML